MPVYASTLARGLLGNKIKEHKLHNNPLLALEPGDEIDIGAVPRHARSGSATRSRTRWASPCGRRSGRSSTPATSSSTTPRSTASCPTSRSSPGSAQEGVLCLLSDSTRAENPGYTPSERTVGEAFREIMEPLDGRVIVATFASNIARVQQVLDAAADMRPQASRSSAARWSRTSGSRPTSATSSTTRRGSSPRTRSRTIPDAKLVIATTGAQGEPMAGLARMANRDHRFVEIQPGDTVIVSASPIPGNEEYVARTIDNLFKAGANVYYHTIKRAHVSGHASQEELKLMLGLTKPKHFIPMHGEFRMQVQHGRLAIETGRRARRTSSSSRTGRRSRSTPTARPGAARPVPAGYVFVDGLSVGEVGDIVLRDRRALANDGMFMIVVTVDKQTGTVVGQPEIITRGFVHLNEQDPIMEEALERVDRGDRQAGRPHQRDRACSRPRSRTASRATCTSRRSAGRWSSRSWSRSDDGDAPADDRPDSTGHASRRGRRADERPAAAELRRTSSARSSGSRCWSSARSR